jgi:hypothetical protein
METTINRWREKLGTNGARPWLTRAGSQQRCDIYLAYEGVQRLMPVGFMLTEKGERDALVAYCPLSYDGDAPDHAFAAELLRGLKIAVRISENPASARDDDAALWLGWVGVEDRPVPQWIYALRCDPLKHDWDGNFVRFRPFCPHLFAAMAAQPKAAAWLRRRQQPGS